MKKIFSTFCMALVAVAMMGQDPVITFEKTEHDFGKINEEDGRVSVVFEFRNEGMSPLVLSNVRASCGCTTPTWTKDPVEPGQTGAITVTYNPNGRPGRFQKTVTITSNAKEATTRVYIKGEVIPKHAKPVNKYTLPVGELSMMKKTLDLGKVKKGEVKNGELEYANLTQAAHQVDLVITATDAYIAQQATLPTIQAGEVGKFVFSLDTKASKVYGPVEIQAYVVVDGKKVMEDSYKLTVKADIVEDFSNLTQEDKQNSPIIETLAEFEAGKIAAGKHLRYSFPIKNSGANALEVRRVYARANNVLVKSAPKAVKSGKKGAVNVEINTTGMEPGNYSREVTIISNDYQHPIKKVRINFIVE